MDGSVVFFRWRQCVTPYIESQKWLPWQHHLEPRNRLCLYRIAWSRKPTPRIKLCVASYHTTKVMGHQTPKSVTANCVPKLVGPPSNTWFLRPIRDHNPNGIPICSAVFAQTTVECPYTLQWDAHSPPKICPFQWGDLEPHLIHGSPGPRKSSTQTAARSVQPFLQGSLVWQTDRLTDRPTDDATRSVRIGRIYVRSTAMRPKNDRPVLFMYALWHPYAAHHIPPDLRDVLRNHITIRKEIWHNITSNYSVPQHTDVTVPHRPPDGAFDCI